jgi:spermidine synthase
MRLFLVGVLSLLCQIVLLRELNVAFYGVELAFAVALAAWMVGSAAGAAVLPRRAPATRGRLSWLIAIAALVLPVEVVISRASRLVLGGVPGAFLPIEHQALTLAAAVLPPSLLLGLAFRLAAELSRANGRTLAWAYALESAGACAGAAIAAVAFVFGVRTFTLAILTAGIVPAALLATAGRRLVLAGRASRVARSVSRLRNPVILLAVLAATAAAAFVAPRIDVRMTAWSHPSVVDSLDSPYARITATSDGSQTALFADDVLVYESEAAQQEELAHVAALQHPAPRRMLQLGGSVEGLDRELRKHRPERLVLVEQDRTFYELAARYLRLPSEVVFDDPRDFLRRSAAFDVIVVATPQPTSGQSNRFYTAEFFEECRAHLAAGGVLAFKLDVPENVVTALPALRAASILAAARTAFRFLEVLPGASAIAVASGDPLPATAGVLVDRLTARGLSTRVVTPAYLRYLYANDRREGLTRLRDAGAAPNADARPVCYQLAALTWVTKFYPGLLAVSPIIADLSPDVGRHADTRSANALYTGGVAAALVVAAGFAIARRLRRTRAVLLASVAGLSGMLLETVLLLSYQARSGALFERVGVLLTAFMAGLAAGAWAVGRLMSRRRRPGTARAATAALLAASAAVGGLTGALVVANVGMGLMLASLLLFAAGSLVAGIFACAGAMAASDAGDAAGRLYGADLVGGAAGSLVAGLVLVPFAGLVPTTWVVVGLNLIALILV